MPSPTPSRRREQGAPGDRGGLPLIRVFGVRVTLAYSVVIVASIILGVTGSRSLNDRTGEAVLAAGLGLLLWILGWVVQMIVYGAVSNLVGWPAQRIRLGLFGIESVPKAWTASSAATVVLATLTALFAIASMCWLVGSEFELQQSISARDTFWGAPSLGAGAYDSHWLSAAWLFFVQALCQLYPLNHSLGRTLLAAGIVGWFRPGSIDLQIQTLRRLLLLVAWMTVLVAGALFLDGRFPQWLVTLVIGIVLWISSPTSAVASLIGGMNHDHRDGPAGDLHTPVSQWLRDRDRQRRIRRALKQEHGEAMDHDALDEVLGRLHQGGIESLSKEDRKLLRRVSQQVRQRRDAGPGAG